MIAKSYIRFILVVIILSSLSFGCFGYLGGYRDRVQAAINYGILPKIQFSNQYFDSVELREVAAATDIPYPLLRLFNSGVVGSGSSPIKLPEYQELYPRFNFGNSKHRLAGRIMWPVLGQRQISSYYGLRGGRPHRGIDIRAPHRSMVFASHGGKVTYSDYYGAYGRFIEVVGMTLAGENVKTRYAHLDKLFVEAGDEIGRGEVIGLVGKSGNATGYHLHFEIKVNHQYQDPLAMY